MTPTDRRPVIVVGYDGSEASRAAVTLAARRAGHQGLVFVVHAYALPPDFLGSPDYDRLLSEREEHGRALSDALPLTGNNDLLDVEYETELIGGHQRRRSPTLLESGMPTRSSSGRAAWAA
jgi:nucleotide-binding universal stress UspA family protein